MIQPQFAPHPARAPGKPDRSAHRARRASERRRRRARRRTALIPLRIVAFVGVLLVPVLGYVMLTANLTGLSYALDHENAHRSALLEETARLDDRIARLTSRERLAAVAVRLKLHDPDQYAVVRLPEPRTTPPARGLALLDWLVPR